MLTYQKDKILAVTNWVANNHQLHFSLQQMLASNVHNVNIQTAMTIFKVIKLHVTCCSYIT